MFLVPACIGLAATAVSASRNRRQWEAYNLAHLTRTKLVNSIAATGALGVVTLVLFIL